MQSVIPFYQQLKHNVQSTNHRQLLSLQGNEAWCFKQSIAIIDQHAADYKWCGKAPSSIESTIYQSLLGQDVQLLILNMQQGFDANMFAAAEGSVCGGCIIILLMPHLLECSAPFCQYMLKQLKLHQIPILNEYQHPPQIKQIITNTAFPSLLDTTEQQHAIEKIVKTVTGHRRRPLVLTANRGRGKSASLGIAAGTLINQGIPKIIICAPNKQAATTLYKHAKLTFNHPDDLQKLQFIAPDALAAELPVCNLLIIDEAAAIPIKLLALFTQHYSRLVFSTTQFGYEGSGRGFALRFQKQLNRLAPQWRSLHLNHPIRWSKDDPVEAFTLSSLCLAEQSETLSVINQPSISIITCDDLLQQPLLLNQIFSLLINAHYQTKPSDLSALFNDKNQTIIAMQQGAQVLAIAIVNHEGNFNNEISNQIYLGKRRPSGHLIAQSFTFHSGFKEAATQSYARIQRIAVQPSLQSQGLGGQLLDWIINWAQEQLFDHVSASFGGTTSLLQFWLTHHLRVLRIGTRKDKSSGEHSIMMNLPLSQQGKELHLQMEIDFNKQVKIQLSRQLRLLDSSLVVALWPQIASNPPLQSAQQSLSAYINANRAYENVEYLLIELLIASSLTSLTCKQQYCVIEKIIQNHSWQVIVEQHGFTGQKEAQTFIKQCICDLLTQTLVNEPREQHHETR